MHLTSREFNQRVGQAQRAADTAPVFITNRGKPAYVLLSHAQYQQLAGSKQTALQALTPPPELAAALENVEFELPARSPAQRPPVDLGD